MSTLSPIVTVGAALLCTSVWYVVVDWNVWGMCYKLVYCSIAIRDLRVAGLATMLPPLALLRSLPQVQSN